MPQDILDAWRAAGRGARRRARPGATASPGWTAGKRRVRAPASKALLPLHLKSVAQHFKEAWPKSPSRSRPARRPKWCWTRSRPSVPELVTGSADLTGSNNTKVAATPAIAPGNYAGRYIH